MSVGGITLKTPRVTRLAPADAALTADQIASEILNGVITLDVVGIIAELATLGQVEAATALAENYMDCLGLKKLTQDLNLLPLEIGLKIPMQRYYNSFYQPKIPDPQTLVALKTRRQITTEAYYAWMSEQGFPEWASEIMASSQTKTPDLNTLLELVRRKFITETDMASWIRLSGYHPTTEDYVTKLRWQLPGYADIISIYMREGYLEEKWVEIPPDFIDYMSQQGYDSEWAKRIWGKHWVLPGVDHLYEMFHKKIINVDAMAQMLKYHDFEPVWRQRLIDNAYSMIPRVDLRRAYRYGMLSTESLQERYEWLGYKPSDALIMSGIATRSSLDRYYTRLETVARAAFRKGKLSEEGFISILREINTPETAISLTLESETIAREAAVLDPAEEPRTLTAVQYCTLYREGVLNYAFARLFLLGMGYSKQDTALMLELYKPRPAATEVNSDLISAASTLYREGLMAEDEFRGTLRKAGLSEEAISSKVEAEELRYRLDYARDLIALFKEGYKKDIYTAEEFESSLLAYGMQPERVMALVALEQLRKLPKPKVKA